MFDLLVYVMRSWRALFGINSSTRSFVNFIVFAIKKNGREFLDERIEIISNVPLP